MNKPKLGPPKKRRKLAATLAPLMFALATFFLAGLATLVVVWVDMPSLGERTFVESNELQTPPSDAASKESIDHDDRSSVVDAPTNRIAFLIAWLMVAIWPIFLAEAVLHLSSRPWSPGWRQVHISTITHCLIPPLRLCARSPEVGGAIWFPHLGWRVPDDQLRTHLAKVFSIPMLGIAVLILPVLGTEFFLSEQVHRHAALRFALHFSTGLIWFAFAAEFIVMVSVAEDKFDYCKRHWLDLAIILLPLISFLRSLQVLRATRLAKLTKVQQLSRMARIYRLRGVSMKLLRALVLFDLVERIIRISPARKLASLRRQRTKLERELRDLDERIAKLEQIQQSRE